MNAWDGRSERRAGMREVLDRLDALEKTVDALQALLMTHTKTENLWQMAFGTRDIEDPKEFSQLMQAIAAARMVDKIRVGAAAKVGLVFLMLVLASFGTILSAHWHDFKSVLGIIK